VRVLVIADIHANRAALSAVAREPHDAVICLGDVVGFGAEPGACIAWVRAHANVVILGDYDRAAAGGPHAAESAAFGILAAATAPITASQLAPDDIGYLNSLPARAHVEFDGVRYMAVHGTPSNPWYGRLGPDAEEWTDEIRGLRTDVLLVGHTHAQFQIQAGAVRIISPGSVGQPRDKDPRAAYAVLEHGHVRLRRTDYAVCETVAALKLAGVDQAIVRASTALWTTGRVGRMLRELPWRTQQ